MLEHAPNFRSWITLLFPGISSCTASTLLVVLNLSSPGCFYEVDLLLHLMPWNIIAPATHSSLVSVHLRPHIPLKTPSSLAPQFQLPRLTISLREMSMETDNEMLIRSCDSFSPLRLFILHQQKQGFTTGIYHVCFSLSPWFSLYNIVLQAIVPPPSPFSPSFVVRHYNVTTSHPKAFPLHTSSLFYLVGSTTPLLTCSAMCWIVYIIPRAAPPFSLVILKLSFPSCDFENH